VAADLSAVEHLADRVVALHPGRRVRVGVDGVDGAGKTTLAAALAEAVRGRGRTAVHVSEDGFHRPATGRHARGRDDPEGFYRDSYDDDALLRELLRPFGPGGDGRYADAVHDVVTDRPVPPVRRTAAPDEVLVLDGIFLQRAALEGCFDLVVLLDVPWAETYRRMALRDGCPPDPDHPANRRYRQGQQLYLDERDPVAGADVVLAPGADGGWQVVGDGAG
jgi:uridine kinase